MTLLTVARCGGPAGRCRTVVSVCASPPGRCPSWPAAVSSALSEQASHSRPPSSAHVADHRAAREPQTLGCSVRVGGEVILEFAVAEPWRRTLRAAGREVRPSAAAAAADGAGPPRGARHPQWRRRRPVRDRAPAIRVLGEFSDRVTDEVGRRCLSISGRPGLSCLSWHAHPGAYRAETRHNCAGGAGQRSGRLAGVLIGTIAEGFHFADGCLSDVITCGIEAVLVEGRDDPLTGLGHWASRSPPMSP